MDFKFHLDKFLDNLNYFFITLLFGVASFLFKVREKEVKLTLSNAFMQLTFSATASYSAFKLGSYFNINPDLLSVFVGIAAWSGREFLVRLENIMDKYLNKKFDLIDSKESMDNDK